MARPVLAGLLLARAAADLASSYRKDAFLPYDVYPEAHLPDPTSGGRIHVIGTSLSPCPKSLSSVVYINGVLVDVNDTTTQPPAEWAFDWLRVEPPIVKAAGEPVWVSFHSRQAVWDSRTSASIDIKCGASTLLNGTFPVVIPAVAVTWVTIANDTSGSPAVVISIKHQSETVSAQTAKMVLLNGLDVTAFIPQDQRAIPVGQGALWLVPVSALGPKSTEPGAVWTVAVSWEDPTVPGTAAGGNFWSPIFPVETWPGGKDCPFPGANTSNYIIHREHGVSTFLLDHEPKTDGGPGCAGSPSAKELVDRISIEDGFWTLVSFGFMKPNQISNHRNVAGWFLADEDDQNIGLSLRQDASNTAELHRRTPGVPTYQGGSRNRFTGTFAGSTDIKGLDFYIGACAPHVTEWGSRQLLRGSFDYLRNARNNHMPGPTWLYSQAFDDSWNAFDGLVQRQLDTAEIAVSIMSVIAAGAKGLMYFMTEVRYTQGETASTWAALGALSREVAALSELYRGGDVSGNVVAALQNGTVDEDTIVEATLSPQGIVLTLINIANDGGYADLPCGVGEVQHWKITPHIIDLLNVSIPTGLCIVDTFELVNATVVNVPAMLGGDAHQKSTLCGPTTYTLSDLALAPTWPGVTRTIVLATTETLRVTVEAALLPWSP